MIIYRDGKEILEIKDFKVTGKFMEVAVLDCTVKSATPIEFKIGDYVVYDYNGLTYSLYDVPTPKKQARSGTYGEAFTYELKFKSDMEQLVICPFLDLVANDNGLHYTSLPSFSTFENVYGIATRIQANMDYLYPGKWRIEVAATDDAELLETLNEAKDFGVSGQSCLEGLKKIYDTWGVGYIHSVDRGVNVITIGKSAGTTSLFRYGMGQGLRTIKKSLQNTDQFCTRVYAYGSTRNIPARWYNEKGYIGEAQYAPYLMIPPSKWVDGIPQGAYIDAIFNGEDRIEKYGLRIKTFSYDGSNGRDEIFPSIEKVTAGNIRTAKVELGETKYIPSNKYADTERMDYVLEGSNIDDDGTTVEAGYELYSDSVKAVISPLSETFLIAEDKGDGSYKQLTLTKELSICRFDISKTAEYKVKEIDNLLTFEKNEAESTVNVEFFMKRPAGDYLKLSYVAYSHQGSARFTIPLVESAFSAEMIGAYTLVARVTVGWSESFVNPFIPEEPIDLSYTIAGGEAIVYRGTRNLAKSFTIKLKQIGFDLNTVTASDGSAKTISLKSGMCSGRSFVITKCWYSAADDSWVLTCKRAVDSSISQTFPNSVFPIAAGDQFILLNINMPDLYVHTAMQRLYDTALADLKHYSNPQFVVSPEIDNLQMARSPQTLKEGMYMPIEDADINIDDDILIDGVTITEKGTELRRFDVTLRNDKIYNRFSKIATSLSNLENSIEEAKKASNNTPVSITDNSVILEGSPESADFGLSLIQEDGKTWLRSKYDFYSEGEVASGGPSGSNPDEPSSSIVSVEQILTEGTPIAKVIVDGEETTLYAPESYDVDLSAYATIDYVDAAIQNAEDTRVDELINTTIPALESDIAKRALQTTLDTHISNYNSFATSTTTILTAHDKRIKSFEDMFEWDGESIKAKADFYSIGEVSSGGLSTGESTGGVTRLEGLEDVYLDNLADGQVLAYDALNDKWVNKVVNTGVSGDYLPMSGGTLTGSLHLGDLNSSTYLDVAVLRNGLSAYMGIQGTQGAIFGYSKNGDSKGLIIDSYGLIYDDNNTQYNLLHSGNISNYAVQYYWADQDANDFSKPYVSFSYQNNTPCVGPIASFGARNYGIQLHCAYGWDGDFYIRKFAPSSDGGVGSWHELIHSGNIGQYTTGGGTACLPLTGGTLTGNHNVLNIDGRDNSYILFRLSSVAKASVGYYNNFAYVANENTYARIGIANDGTPQYWPHYDGSAKYTLIHSGGGTINGTLVIQTTSNGGVQLYQNGINGYSNGNYENLHLNINSPKNVSLCYGGGNVLIGTTTDKAVGRLQVAGGVNCNVTNIGSGVGLSLWGDTNATGYGICMADRYSFGGVHGSATGYYNIYFNNGDVTFGWIWRNNTGCVASISGDGNFVVNGEVTSGASASDMRLKDIVCNDYDAVSIIKNLSTFKYKWNSTAKSLTDCFSKDNYEHFGLSAQEVEKVSGYLVSNFNYGEGREYLTLKKDELVPVLVQAVKQLLTRIEILEGK